MRTGDSRCLAGRTKVTLRSGRPLESRNPLRALDALTTLRALLALATGRAKLTLRASIAPGTLRAGAALWADASLRSSATLVALSASWAIFRPCRSGRANGAGVTCRADVTSRAARAGRTCRAAAARGFAAAITDAFGADET